MRRKRWRWTEGTRPNTVTVSEREPGGPLYIRAWDPKLRGGRGNWRRESLGHKDREAAKERAKQEAGNLLAGSPEETIRTGRLTVKRLFALWLVDEPGRKDAERLSKLWTRFLHPDKDVRKITPDEWRGFIRLRRSGEIDARGHRVDDPEKRRPVRDRTVEADLRAFAAVVSWAVRWRDREGRRLLYENPVLGLEIPTEKNPRRPVATQGRYEALLAVADRVMYEAIMTETGEDGKRRRKRVQVPSCLPELLVLANETGRRLSAILGLTYEDVNPERRPTAPHGSITWRADLDKKGREWPDVPMTAAARAAIDRVLRERPGIGPVPLFPSPKGRAQPLSRYLAGKWLLEAEKLAGLEHEPGGGWHSFRRKAATEMKHAPDVDVMQALGWTDLRSLKTAYQHADPETMLVALERRGELREVR
ncbi:MAG: tyrosine-type recombinase/integrase [Gemmatimonadota bacterium]